MLLQLPIMIQENNYKSTLSKSKRFYLHIKLNQTIHCKNCISMITKWTITHFLTLFIGKSILCI